MTQRVCSYREPVHSFCPPKQLRLYCARRSVTGGTARRRFCGLKCSSPCLLSLLTARRSYLCDWKHTMRSLCLCRVDWSILLVHTAELALAEIPRLSASLIFLPAERRWSMYELVLIMPSCSYGDRREVMSSQSTFLIERARIWSRMTASVLKQHPNTKRFKRTLI